MSVDSTGGLSAVLNQPTQQAQLGSDSVSRDDFLRLLVAQLQNQDPLNPVENQEFVAELATFSSLEQQTAQTELLQQLVSSQQSNSSSQALSILGKDVAVAQNQFSFNPGDQVDFVFQAPRTGEALVQVTSDSGHVVYTDRVQVTQAGQIEYSFDGLNAQGQSLPPGVYSISFGGAISNSGEVTEYPAFMRGTVDGVTFVEGSPVLTVNNQPVPFSAVQAVMERGDDQ